MDSELTDQEIQAKLDQRFRELPKVLQDAIHSADIEAHMRILADQHKLHFDQWQLLENDVMLTLFGFQDPEDLAENFRDDLGVDQATADSLAEDVSNIVFAPIRAELEKGLQFAVEAEESDGSSTVPGAEAAVVAEHPLAQIVPAIAPILPGTPPPPPPETRAVRAPISESYSAGQASHERKIIEGDPYRESAV
ncbi:MAG TPA: hypothetical protein VJK53_06025 [Candidatus Paceibacterota bacterium]